MTPLLLSKQKAAEGREECDWMRGGAGGGKICEYLADDGGKFETVS